VKEAMDVLVGERTVLVRLSRRNLEQLLAALDRGSEKGLVRRCEGTVLMVEAEENERHYQELPPLPTRLHARKT
jgi:hypothetical protein